MKKIYIGENDGCKISYMVFILRGVNGDGKIKLVVRDVLAYRFFKCVL